MAIMGEMNLLEGHTKVNGSVSYVPQDAWIYSATIRENVLFGKEFDVKTYRAVIEVSALIQVELIFTLFKFYS